MQLIITFILTVITFHINYKIKKIIDIKIIINSLFELYGQKNSFQENDSKEVNILLMQEILHLEKMHDNNIYIKNQIKYVRELRAIYYEHSINNWVDINSKIERLEFKPLNKTFIVLGFLNLS